MRAGIKRYKGDPAMETPELPDTTPCYLLLRSDGTADIAVLGDEQCLCIFTDERNIGPFYRARYGGDFESKDVGTLKFDGPARFRGFLRSNEATLASQGVRHMAIDPTPQLPASRVPIRAFIDA